MVAEKKEGSQTSGEDDKEIFGLSERSSKADDERFFAGGPVLGDIAQIVQGEHSGRKKSRSEAREERVELEGMGLKVVGAGGGGGAKKEEDEEIS